MSKEEAEKGSANSKPIQPIPLDLAGLREDYRKATLSKTDVAATPFEQFEHWFRDAQSAGVPEPNAMVLATVDSAKMPSTRTVLLKGLEDGAFIFFTNYASRKGREIAKNPQAAATFLWKELERQVCVRGTIDKSSRADSEDYFHSRPYASQIGAHASTQSLTIINRKSLESR
jgi:pyridoxamine 5'-phosphate oxidase